MPRYHHGVRTNANPSVAVTSCSIVDLASKFLPHISPNNRHGNTRTPIGLVKTNKPASTPNIRDDISDCEYFQATRSDKHIQKVNNGSVVTVAQDTVDTGSMLIIIDANLDVRNDNPQAIPKWNSISAVMIDKIA